MITMMMGSGGIYFYAFDCNGIAVEFIPTQEAEIFLDQAQKNGILIYSNVPI